LLLPGANCVFVHCDCLLQTGTHWLLGFSLSPFQCFLGSSWLISSTSYCRNFLSHQRYYYLCGTLSLYPLLKQWLLTFPIPGTPIPKDTGLSKWWSLFVHMRVKRKHFGIPSEDSHIFHWGFLGTVLESRTTVLELCEGRLVLQCLLLVGGVGRNVLKWTKRVTRSACCFHLQLPRSWLP